MYSGIQRRSQQVGLAMILLTGLLSSVQELKADLIVDQTPLGGGNQAKSISSAVSAASFTLSGATTLGDFKFWLLAPPNDDDDISDYFSGDLSVGLYGNSGSGKPGSFMGSANFSSVAMTDAGFNGAFDWDVAYGTVNLESFGELAGGDYWLAMHENEWLSPSDGLDTFWYYSGANTGSNSWTDNEANPSNWLGPTADTPAFTLAAAVPEPSNALLFAFLAPAILMMRRNRGNRHTVSNAASIS